MTIFFDKHYFSEKQEFGEYIQQNVLDLAAKQSALCCKREEELFYSCNSGDFKNFCGLPSGEGEFIPTLEAIKECLALPSNFPFYLNNYCSCENIFILDGTQRIDVFHNQTGGYYVNPFCLNTARDCNATIDFVLNYYICNTIPQKLVPSLEFYSEDKLVHSYLMVDNSQIDLSQKGQKSISFKIPAIDIFTQSAGYYVIKFGLSEFAKVEFPRCGLPINGGIYSFSELREFCDKLNGSPTCELLSFYNILKRGELAIWLQDNKEEGKYKKEIYEAVWKIKAEHPFRINDINSILKIISNRTINFPIQEYLSIAISGINSKDVIGEIRENDKSFYFVRWNSTTIGELNVVITPVKNCENLDIDFNLAIKAQSSILVDNISVNLRDIEQREERVLDFKIIVPPDHKMGEKYIYIHDKQGYTQETKVYIVVTGEKVLIPLLDDTSITMIGVYSLKREPFYIAQTPLTQKQVKVLINIAERKNLSCYDLKRAIERAIEHDGENENLPCSFMEYWGKGAEINRILNATIPLYEFNEPTAKELEIALYDGLCDYIPYKPARTFEKLQSISLQTPIHSTRLGVFDLLGNILSITSSHVGLLGTFLAFGTTYRCPLQTGELTRRIDKIEDFYIGFRPKMVRKQSNPQKSLVKQAHDDNSGSSSIESTSWMEHYITDIDF